MLRCLYKDPVFRIFGTISSTDGISSTRRNTASAKMRDTLDWLTITCIQRLAQHSVRNQAHSHRDTFSPLLLVPLFHLHRVVSHIRLPPGIAQVDHTLHRKIFIRIRKALYQVIQLGHTVLLRVRQPRVHTLLRVILKPLMFKL